MRLKLVPSETTWDFFRRSKISLGLSGILVIASIVAFFAMGLNFGIDFRGGTSIRTESSQPLDVAVYRGALTPLEMGDVAITQVFDPSFGEDKFVSLIRIEAQEGDEAITPEDITAIKDALLEVDPFVSFPAVESVGPEVSGELIQSAIIAVLAAIGAVLVYIWLRFEWQFGLAAVIALGHDVALTIGVFEITGIEFNLAIIAALLTIVGYSLNDTVVVFDRVRENLRKYKQLPLVDLMNLSLNETLSRTLMTSITTLIALIAMFVLGPEVIKGFTFAMIWGVIVGTYSSVFVAVAALLWLGVKRDWTSESEAKAKAGTQFGGAQV